nr:hypothetical protein [Tanacetum cinerariifolium]
MDGGDDGDDDEGDSSGDNADDEDENEEEEEEEEDLALTDSAVVIPTDELVSPPEGTKPADVKRFLTMPTPSPSPLTSVSPPSAGERLARCTTLAALPSPPLPPPLYMPPPIDRRDDIPKIEMPPRKRLCLSTQGSRYEVGDSSTARPTGGQWIDYGFVSTLDVEARRRGIRQRVDLLIEDRIAYQETIQIVEDEAYATREAWAHSIRLSQAVYSELRTHQEQVYAHKFQLQKYQTQLQLQSTLIHTQYQLYETRFQMQQTEIAELRDTDHRRQAQMAETLRVMGDIRREMGVMQAELLALLGQPRRAGQPGGDARVLNHQDAPRDANSHI